MPEFAIIVVSDLHAGDDNRHQELRTRNEGSVLTSKHFGLTALYDAIAPVVESVASKNRVLVCAGDLTDRCHSSELSCASTFLQGLAEKLEIPAEHRFLVPGNHDVDWALTKLTAQNNDPWYATQRQAKFLEFLKASGYRFPTNGNPRHYQLMGGAVDFLLLDSPFEDLNDRTPHHGNLGKPQIELLDKLLGESAPDSTRIVVLHHHITALGRSDTDPDFSLLSDARELQEILKKNFVNLVIHGHQHRAGFEQIEGLLRPIAVLGTGSTTAPYERLEHGIFNSFHVVAFDAIKGADACGVVHTRQFTHTDGWRKPSRGEISLPPSRPFGHVFTSEQVDKWATQINDLCDTNESVKIDDFLGNQINGAYYQTEDMIHVLRRRIKIANSEGKYEFLFNEEQNYWQMQLLRGTKKIL